MAAEVAHPPTVAEAATATHTQVPALIARAEPQGPVSLVDENRRATDNQPSLFLLFKDERTVYQTPLSLPVILNATAAAEASGGSRLRRKVAGTLPLKAAWVICFV
jgi:hypothetical protein